MECRNSCGVQMIPSDEEEELVCPTCGLVYCLACQGWMDDAYTGEEPPEPVEPDCGV